MSSREQIKQYLLSKGLPELQVQGILLNIEDESGFSANPSGPNDAGNSYGLFQHNGPRKRALFKHAGSSSPSWQQQVDYALSEPDMANYLQGSYSNVGDAAVGFLDRFERPAKKHRDARAAKYRSQYGHWSPSGGAVDMAAVTPGPAYQNQGTVAPVDMGGIPTLAQPAAGGAPMNPNDDISRALARLEAIRNGLAQPPQQPQMDPWQMLGNLGTGILNAGGGPGAGNWFGRGMANVQRQMPEPVQPMTPLEQLKAEGELSKFRADLLTRQAEKQWRSSLTDEQKLMVDAGGDPMKQAIMREQMQETFGGGAEGTAKMQNYRFLVEQGVSPQEAMQRVGLGATDATGALAPKDRVGWSNTMMDNFRQETAPLSEPVRRWNDVGGYTPGEMNGAQQRNLIVAYAKALDPTSAVMEGEADAVAQAAQSFPIVRDLYRRAVDSSLTGDEQANLMAELRQLATQRYGELEEAHGRYTQQFQAAGFEDSSPYLGRLPTLKGAEIPPGTDLGGGFKVAE